MKCESCGNDNRYMFEIDGCEKICLNCGTMERLFITRITEFDLIRTNMRKKPVYDQVAYFEKCMMQYQGKQNTKIPDKLLADLQNKFKDGISVTGPSGPCGAFKGRVTRDKIIRFLKELQYKKQSKNVNLIYFELTQEHIDDISHLEHVVVDDLETLLELYKRIYIEDESKVLCRQNFLNVPSLLFQILRNRDHPCEMSNFNILKTSNSMKYHNDVSRNLFEELGWKFTPIEAIK